MWIKTDNKDDNFVVTYRRLSKIATQLPYVSPESDTAQDFIHNWIRLAQQALLSVNLFGLRLLLIKLEKLIATIPEWETVLLEFQGRLALITSQNRLAYECFQNQLSLAKAKGDTKAICQAQLGVGECLIAQLQYNKAEAVLENILWSCEKTCTACDYALLKVQIYNQFGRLYHLRKQWQLSNKYLLQALQISPHITNVANFLVAQEESRSYRWLAMNHQPFRQWDNAEKYLQRSLDLSNQNHDVLGIMEANIQLGAVYYQKGFYDTALICFEGGLAISEQMGYLPMLAQGFYYKALAYIAMDRIKDALEMGQKSLETSLQLNQPEAMSRAYHCLGQIYKILNKKDKALESYLKALELYNPESYYPQWVELLSEAGDFLLSLPNINDYWEKALACYRQAIGLVEAEEKLDYLATLMGRMGRAFTRIKGVEGLEDALRCYRVQLRLAGDLDSPNLPMAEAVALRVQAFMGMQRISALQGNRKINPNAELIKFYYEAFKTNAPSQSVALG
jgi:tetratricopeptide (TPR) repeat protein